jgi:hypothetical protein
MSSVPNCFSISEHRPDLGAVGHVRLHGEAPQLRGTHRLDTRLGGCDRQIVHDDTGPLLGEKQADGTSDPRSSPCHQGNLLLELHGFFSIGG